MADQVHSPTARGVKRGFADMAGAAHFTGQRRYGLTLRDFPIGIICALPLEMTAMKSMFDQRHQTLPTPGDTNTYCLGRIGQHNIVLTCLPKGCYGTNAAAAAASRMKNTFVSIEVYLMVGIGGGVPSIAHDIRLGDVVVSTPRPGFPAVIQYDYGKTELGGISVPKGQLNKPPTALLNACSGLESEHQMKKNNMQTHIEAALNQGDLDVHTYAYPDDKEDKLFEVECVHAAQDHPCECEPPDEIKRRLRSLIAPCIFYGTIGSGNQVIKDGRTRDRLAKECDILCFEMESAGIMDEIPCLVVRGICDYCDSRKTKRFQGYAALSAAAYAKELLLLVNLQQSTIKREEPAIAKDLILQDEAQLLEHRQSIMNTLTFDAADARRDTVKRAHPQTCDWLFEHPDYLDWLNVAKMEEHHGLLWIRGNPGTGKSTLMKHISEELESSMHSKPDKDTVMVSFFFHARGEELEKSSAGLYRSILFQLFTKLPRLQTILDTYLPKSHDALQLPSLQKMFIQAVKSLESTHLFCFIDALDECPEQQMKDLVAFLEELGNIVVKEKIHLRICLSSRHYPHVTVDAGVTFTLEHQEGQHHDLKKYISTELKIGASKQANTIKADIFEKSSKIFLWVVLVVQILKSEYQKGRVRELYERLNSIPQDLEKLFLDILGRDNNNRKELVLCMQWILFAKRPMLREEFYFGLLAQSNGVLSRNTDLETIQVMDRRILDCSKGLAETTRAKQATVQFIHESVREFLHKPGVLDKLWSGFRDVSPVASHQALRNCCRSYLNVDNHAEINALLERRLTSKTLREMAEKVFPFLNYSVKYLLAHAEDLEKIQPSQTVFLAELQVAAWIRLHNMMQRFQNQHYSAQSVLPYILARSGSPHLLALVLRHPEIIDTSHVVTYEELILLALDDKDDKEFTALKSIATIENNQAVAAPSPDAPFEIVAELLHATRNKSGTLYRAQALQIFVKLLQQWGSNNRRTLNEAFLEAAHLRHEEAMTFLLSNGADINASDAAGDTALHRVATHQYLPKRRSKGQIDQSDDDSVLSVMSMLINKGADVTLRNTANQDPIQIAVRNSTLSVIELLLDHQAVDLGDDGQLCQLLAITIQRKNLAIAQRLLAESNAAEELNELVVPDSTTPRSTHDLVSIETICLHRAVSSSSVSVIQGLGGMGVSLESKNAQRQTPLQAAVNNGDASVVTVLLKMGVFLEATDERHRTPLLAALYESHLEIAELLLVHGASAAAKDLSGCNALHVAALKDQRSMIPSLTKDIALLQAVTYLGYTPLHYAIWNGRTEMVKLLFKKGAQMEEPDTGWAMLLAASTGIVEIMKDLRMYGAALESSHATTTPLHVAAQHDHWSVVDYLLSNGANRDSKDLYGRTALQIAEQYANTEIAALLRPQHPHAKSKEAPGIPKQPDVGQEAAADTSLAIQAPTCGYMGAARRSDAQKQRRLPPIVDTQGYRGRPLLEYHVS